VSHGHLYLQPQSGYFVDKLETGFLAWAKTINVYTPGDSNAPIVWDPSSAPALQAMHDVLSQDGFIAQLASLWGQESGKSNATLALRTENVLVIKYIGNWFCFILLYGILDTRVFYQTGKIFGFVFLEKMLEVTDKLIYEPDKFKQRAGAEFLLGILRGTFRHCLVASSFLMHLRIQTLAQ
jgi:proteasome activator subunit 4